MANPRSKVNAALQKLLAKRPRGLTALATLDRFEAELPASVDDRAMVLVSVALVEQALEDAILTRCTKLFETERRGKLFGGDTEGSAVQGFYGKIILGRALGLYGQAFQEDLDRLRRIRNVFAHAKSALSFKSRAIREACDFHMFDARLDGWPRKSAIKTPQHLFLEAAGASCLMLMANGHDKRLRPRLPRKKIWLYAAPAPSLHKPKPPSRRPRRRGDQTQQSHRRPQPPSQE